LQSFSLFNVGHKNAANWPRKMPKKIQTENGKNHQMNDIKFSCAVLNSNKMLSYRRETALQGAL